MCDAVSLAAASLVATTASTGLSVYSAQQQGQAQKQAAEYQAAVAANNAQMVEKQGEQAAQAKMRENAMRLGAQRVTFAANGVDPNSGSALRVQEDSAVQGGLEAANIQYGALVRGMGLMNEAQMARAAGKQAAYAGNMAAAGNLLSGASQVAGRWNSFNEARAAAAKAEKIGPTEPNSWY